MATDRPDPGEFLEMAQRMLRELFGGLSGPPGSSGASDPAGSSGSSGSYGDEDPWAAATRSLARERHREPSPEQQRENLTFALATRAVEALEDLALNVAAIRQRLERTAHPQPEDPTPEDPEFGERGPDPGPIA